MDMASSNGPTAAHIGVIIIKGCVKGLGNTLTVKIQAFRKEYGKKVYLMDKANTYSLEALLINACGQMEKYRPCLINDILLVLLNINMNKSKIIN